jgi:hypothetical protein
MKRIILACNTIFLLFKGIEVLYLQSSIIADSSSFLLNNIAATLLIFGGLFACLSPENLSYRNFRFIFLLPLGSIVYLNIVKFQQSGYLIEQLIEHTVQFFLPLAAIYVLGPKVPSPKFKQFAKFAIAATFIGHALYAIGWHMVPENFLQMCASILGSSNEQSTLFLKFFGILDILAAIFIFFPRLERIGLHYMIAWGLLTALARPIAALDMAFTIEFLFLKIPQATYRLPHAIIPMLLLFWQRSSSTNTIINVKRWFYNSNSNIIS